MTELLIKPVVSKSNQNARREKQGGNTVVQNLLERHEKILDLYTQGLTPVQIAKKLEVPHRQIYNIVHTPAFQQKCGLRRARIEERIEDEIVENTQSVQDYLQEQTKTAAMKLVALLDSPSDTVARQASNDILDRTGFAKVTKNENINTSVEIDQEMGTTIADTLKMLMEQAEPTAKKAERGVSEKRGFESSTSEADTPTP